MGVDVPHDDCADHALLVQMTYDLHLVVHLDVCGRFQSSIDSSAYRPKRQIEQEDCARAEKSLQGKARSGECAHGGTAPEGRGRVDSFDIHPFPQDHAAAEKADAAYDVGGDAAGGGVVVGNHAGK